MKKNVGNQCLYWMITLVIMIAGCYRASKPDNSSGLDNQTPDICSKLNSQLAVAKQTYNAVIDNCQYKQVSYPPGSDQCSEGEAESGCTKNEPDRSTSESSDCHAKRDAWSAIAAKHEQHGCRLE
jgi:hypothetical protein